MKRILLLAAICLVSCSAPNEPETSPLELVPLSAGNHWIGATTYRDSTGALLRRSNDTIVATNDVLFGADPWLLGERFRGLRNGDRGLYLWSRADRSDTWLFLPFPARQGDHLTHAFDPSGSDLVDVHVEATDIAVKVPAGSFDCHRYRISSSLNGFEVIVDLAPGTGFVRTELRDRPGDRYNLGSAVWELHSTNIGPESVGR
jgi:hypothetical protein